MLATHIRRGNVIIHSGVPHRVLDFHHRTPGKGRAFVQAKLRNLKTGASMEVRFSSNEAIDRAILDVQVMEYIYSEGTMHYFMNTENYEQLPMQADVLGEAMDYIVSGTEIKVEFFEERPMGIELPSSVELTVVETTPELKGATASNSPKPAQLETGVTVQVPPFIKEGDRVRVDPHEGTYLERVK